MDTAKAAETRPTRGRNEGTATTDNFEQGQRVLVDLSAFNGHDGTALGTVRGADEYGRVVSAQWVCGSAREVRTVRIDAVRALVSE